MSSKSNKSNKYNSSGAQGVLPATGAAMTLYKYVSERLGEGHPVSVHTKLIEENITAKDTTLRAMAARLGIWAPPTDYGDVRGFYGELDTTTLVRELTRRIKEVTDDILRIGISADRVASFIAMRPEELQLFLLKTPVFSELVNEDFDEETDMWQGRLPLMLKLV